MVKKTKGKHRLDKFYHLAKEQGYRSRAAFKLIQLNRKYDFLSKARSCLDLCAAPGGWLQIAAKYMPMQSLIVGVDLMPIQAIRGCQTFVEDITTPACRTKVKKIANGALFDVVLHDGAPNVGGAWSSEASMQTYLVLESLRLGVEFLSPGGTFVTKIFRSQDYTALLYAFKQLFYKVEATKPLASRTQSAEIFVVCQGYKAPAKVDPRLLDAKSVFANLEEVSKPKNVLEDTGKRRHRDGYEDGVSVLYQERPIMQFIHNESPVEMLGQVNKLLFDGTGEGYELMEAHKDTTEEVRACCGDLRVLGKREFKQLLKWRVAVLKAMALQEKEEKKAALGEESEEEAEEEEEEGSEDEDEKLLAEMGEVRELLAAKKKTQKKHEKKVKKKARERAAMGMQGAAGEGETIYSQDVELFSLKSVTGKEALKKLGPTPEGGGEGRGMEAESDTSSSEEEGGEESESEYDSDEATERHHAQVEAALDTLYDHYKGAKTGKSRERRKRARLGRGDLDSDEEGLSDQPGEESGDEALEALGKGSYGGKERSALMADVPDAPRAQGAALTSQWFSQGVFDGADEEDEEDEAGGGAAGGKGKGKGAAQAGGAKAARRAAAAAAAAAGGSSSDEDGGARGGAGGRAGGGAGAGGRLRAGPAAEDSEEEEEEEEEMYEDEDEGMRLARMAAEQGIRRQERRGDTGDADFEEVPLEPDRDSGSSESGSSDSEGSEDEFDPETMGDRERAEIKAYGKALLDTKRRNALLDDAYNRYSFHDEGLPRWFIDEERRHMKPQVPITKDEYQEAMGDLKAIDARPMKKVAEAKARKKMRVAKKMEMAKSRANKVADQEEMGARTKAKEIEKILAKAAAQSKNKQKDAQKLVRAKKGQVNGRGKTVDRRLLADKRGEKARAKKMGAKGGVKKKGGGGGGGGGRGGKAKGGKR